MKPPEERFDLINKKISEVQANEPETKTQHKPKRKPPQAHRAESSVVRDQSNVRARINRDNAKKSTGPRTPEGKHRASANSLKHGFFANVEKLHPHDAPAYQSTLSDLRMGLQPDGPVEEQLVRELAMFTTRLQRLEAAEYALLAGNTEADPEDCREIAAAFQRAAADLEALHKIEIHLRRAYNRTWDRLEKMQKERHKLPLDESLKRSQIWLTYYAQKEKLTRERNQAEPQHVEVLTSAQIQRCRPNNGVAAASPERTGLQNQSKPGHSGSDPDFHTQNKALRR